MSNWHKPLVWSALLCCLATAAYGEFGQNGPKLVDPEVLAYSLGWSVALSADGNTALVGEPFTSSSGGAIVFTRAAGVWTQQGPTLVGSGAMGLSQQGYSVALAADGNTAIVGGARDNPLPDGTAIGAAWVFTRSGGVWTQQGNKLVGSGASGGAGQGGSVALSADGNTALIGGGGDNNGAGAVWMFVRSGGVWTQQGAKLAGASRSNLGTSIGLSADGNTAIAGAPGLGSGNGAGAALIFKRTGGVWSQAGAPLLGSGAAGFAGQGYRVALSADGSTAVVGGPNDNGGAGAVWVFTRSGDGTWTQQGTKLVGSGAVGMADQGYALAVSADGNMAVVGGPYDNGGPGAGVGATWVYTRSVGAWSQQGSKLVGSGATYSANQGWSVALSADASTLLVGGPSDNAVWAFLPINTSLASSMNPSNYGQTVTFTATPPAGATGAVTFMLDNVELPPVALSVSQARLTISSLSAGNHAIGATYSGDANFGSSTSKVLNQVVNKAPPAITLSVSASASPYSQFQQLGPKLVGSGGTTSPPSAQGSSVALSADGNTALVGGWGDNNVGAVWVFTRSGVLWSQQGDKLVGSGASAHASQGQSVALSADGNTALVGGPDDNNSVGGVWVFTRSGGVWTQQGNKLVGGGAAGPAHMGSSVALSKDGNTALVGGWDDNNGVGAVWVFTRSGGVWTQQGSKLVGTGASGLPGQGGSVALSEDGNTALVGGGNDNANAGAVWVFTRSGDLWTQQGSKLVGTGARNPAGQGRSVALSADGNTALDGGPFDNAGIGATWVFTRSAGVWSQQGNKLVGYGVSGSFSDQGGSVSLSADGNTALVGGYIDNGNAGAAWAFKRSGAVWTQQGSKFVGSGASWQANEGTAVSLSADGRTALVGGPADNPSGAAWIFVATSVITGPLSPTPNSVAYSQPVNLVATVTPGATGIVTFIIDGVPQPLLGLSNSQTEITISNLSIGTHSITAAYSGDGNVLESTSPVWNLIIDKAPTTVGLVSSANPAVVRDVVTFTATVTAGATGSVTFTIDGVAQPPVALSGGQARFAISSLSPGTHVITAAYSGDAYYAGSTSPVLNQTIEVMAAVTLTLTSSPNPSTVGQAVTFTASVSGGSGGAVQFYDRAALLGSAAVSREQATFVTSSLSLGSHAILARYNSNTSIQSSIGQVVNGMPSTTALSANPAAIVLGQAVVLTAQVGPAPPAGFAAPTGQVAFQDNASPAGTAMLSSGNATLTLTNLTLGMHQITAIYGGDKTWSSSFARTTVTVTQPALQVTNAATNLSSSFAPDETVSVFNVTSLAGDAAAPSLPLPFSLGGVSVTITDSAGAARPALLYGVVASLGQVNLVIPSDTAMGPATLTIAGQSAKLNIARTAPGLFTGGQVIHVHADGSQTSESFSGNPVDLGAATDRVFLVLYGTGLRFCLAEGSLTAMVNGISVPVKMMPQGIYPGLDQVNLELPRSLAG
ncbi:MAG: hypothetical protein C5B51_20200, partial [Terriglobia bacterium]